MRAPTVWEEGRWSSSRVTRFSIFVCILLVTLDLTVSGRLSPTFDAGFVVLCVVIALAIRPSEFFSVGIMPPMLLLALSIVLAVADPGAIAARSDGPLPATISGLAHHSGSLLVGYTLALGVLAIRARVIRTRAELAASTDYSNRDVSPAPYRVISGAPEVKSTTVVGNDPHSPESITASNT